MNYDAVTAVLAAFEREGVKYAVFGGAALNLHGLARFTEDLDVFLAPDRENVEALKRALRSVYSDPNIDEISADDLLGSYPAVQYIPPNGEFHIDLLTRLGTAFSYSDLEVERVPLGDLDVSVVTPRTLHEMKKDTVRSKDKADADALRRKFGIEDEP